MTRLAFPAVLTALALTLGGCATATATAPVPEPVSTATASQSATTTPSATFDDDPASMAGMYLTYEEYQAKSAMLTGHDVVLFFHASWCPTCKAAHASLASDGVPDGLAVVKVDYDSMADLKRTYRITQQHTFVQLDDQGSAVKTWTGSRTGAEIREMTS